MKTFAQRLMAVISAVVLMTTLLIPAFQASAASVKLNKAKIVIAVGQTYALKLRGTNKTVKWASSNKKVVSVNKKGVIKGVKKGTATVTARVGKKTYKCKVTVEAPKLSATKKTVTAGTSFALKLNGTKRTVKWYTGNKKIATVSQKGVVKTLKAGTVKITAKVGGKSYVCTVTVKAKQNNNSAAVQKAATTYNTLVNNLKKEQNVTIQKDYNMLMKATKISDDLKFFIKMAEAMTGEKIDLSEITDGIKETGKETRVFKDGKATLSNGSSVTVDSFVPPEGKTTALKASYIKSAKTVKTSDGGYKLTIVLKSETSKFDGKNFTATPGNASVSETLGAADFGMGDGIGGIGMNLVLSGTTLEATVNAAGKITSLAIKAPMTMSMSVMGIGNITMGGYNNQTLTIKY